MDKKLPFVSIVVVNFNGRHFLKECFGSLAELNYPRQRLEIIMVDNGSVDGSIEYMAESYPYIKIIKNDANNYSRANNLGIKAAKGEYIALLNNDTQVEKNWLIALVEAMQKDNHIAAVGSKIVFLDGKIQSTGHIEFPYHYWGDRGLCEDDQHQYETVQEVKSISNCSALYRREIFEKIGTFDEDFNMYMEDVDMAFRIRSKKYRILYSPESLVYHHLHGSGQDDEVRQFFIERNRLIFLSKHFPDKLPEFLFGFGAIARLKSGYFQKIWILIIHKLLKHHGIKKTIKLLPQLEESIDTFLKYQHHRASVETNEKLVNLENDIKSLNELLSAKERELKNYLEELKNQREQIKSLENQVLFENKNKQEIVARYEEELNIHKEHMKELQDKYDSKIAYYDKQVRNLNDELQRIYTSETYRFFVKPVIWPLLTFMKGIKGAVSHLDFFSSLRLKNRAMGPSIAQFYSSNTEAHQKQKNEYFIKLYNKEFKTKRIKITLDIWPTTNQSHPHRHFAYFAIDVVLNPLETNLVKFEYDWDTKIRSFCNDKEVPVADFWRGSLNTPSLYAVIATAYDFESGASNKLAIVQRYINE
jgi:GT2 family glycosyltransferase